VQKPLLPRSSTRRNCRVDCVDGHSGVSIADPRLQQARDPILRLDCVTRVHGQGDTAVSALSSVSLSVRAGELVAVLGESGSGKSTLLALAGGLDEPSSGEVFLEGRALTGMSYDQIALARRRHVGYVFQDFNLIPGLTAAENVSLPLELDGRPLAECRSVAARELERVNLGDLGNRYPAQLSGGQQQRVAIARALIGDRRLLLADEPTGSLDRRSGEMIMQLIRDRCSEGTACVLVTHNESYAKYADHVVYLVDGQQGDSPVEVRT
jgi:putative ABC transport system ATP-binding protein